MMQTITFECEVITPMFLAGADGVTPELRPASIKGALRFWWRALNGHLGLDEMRRIEGNVFGSTSQRSALIIMIEQHLRYDGVSKKSLLPHKGGSTTPNFSINESFTLKLSLTREDRGMDIGGVKSLFILTCVLGGLGKRSRRGFGGFKINKIKQNNMDWIDYNMPSDLGSIFSLLPSAYFKNDSITNSITSNFSKNEEYPYIKQIEIGRSFDDLPKEIINASHEVKEKEYDRAEQEAKDRNDFFENRKTNQREPNSKKYSNFEGAIGDGAKRYASPIYVSVLGDKPIITTLNHVPPNNRIFPSHTTLQTEFKNKLK